MNIPDLSGGNPLAMEELKRALYQNSMATQKQEQMKKDREYAIALRDKQSTQGNPISIIGDIMQYKAGKQQLAALDQQQAPLMDQQASSGANIGLEELRQSRLGQALEQERSNISGRSNDLGFARLRDKQAQDKITNQRNVTRDAINAERHGMDMETAWQQNADRILGRDDRTAGYRHEGIYKRKGTGETVAIGSDENGVPIFSETGKPLAEGDFADLERMTGTVNYKGGKNRGAKDNLLFAGKVEQTKQLRALEESFTSSHTQIKNLPTEFANKAIHQIQKQDLLKYINDPETSQQTKDAVNWLGQWRMAFTLKERADKFGATLTPGEERSWQEAEGITVGMDPAEMYRRLQQLRYNNERGFQTYAMGELEAAPEGDVAGYNAMLGELWDRDENGKVVPLGELNLRQLPDRVGTSPTGPQPGHVEGGYVFNGGDPSKAENWTKQ